MPKKSKYHEKVTILEEDLLISELVIYLNKSANNHFELGLILDKEGKLLGVINNVDILKGVTTLSNKAKSVADIMNTSPISINEDLSSSQIIKDVKDKVSLRSKGAKNLTRYIPVINTKNQVVNVIDIYTLLALEPIKNEKIEVYGLGFVGLTLAASLSKVGHSVSGIDINKQLIKDLNEGKLPIHEPGLSDLVLNMKQSNKLNFYSNPPKSTHNYFIVCVGTPVNKKGNANLKHLENVLKIISLRLKKGDVVMLRSTVPIGTTRNLAKKLLEEKNQLKAGRDFYLAFTPERTVEGNAMQELKELPQIVGGLTDKCAEIAGSFWRTHSNVIVQADSLEAAELVKLANNSFRDLTFAFSNALAILSDKYNIDSNELIYLANEGYPRNLIARPSPGVGGYCLTKDPLLYASIEDEFPHAKLSRLGREINIEMANYPLKVLNKFIKKENLKLNNMKILIIGLAFKGWPETNDLRGSNGLDLAINLQKKCNSLYVYDALVPKEEFHNFNLDFCDIYKMNILKFDAVFIMNNHPKNIKDDFLKSFVNNKVLVFDGWNQIDKRTAMSYKNIKYANLGYYSHN